jgi:hypothetical protein
MDRRQDSAKMQGIMICKQKRRSLVSRNAMDMKCADEPLFEFMVDIYMKISLSCSLSRIEQVTS